MTDSETDLQPDDVNEAPAAAAPGPSVAPSIIDALKAFGQRRMPTLEYVNDRFVRAARERLFGLIRRPVEMRVESIAVLPYRDIVNAGAGRGHIALSKIHPFNGVGCWVVDSTLVYLVVDTLFGGDSRIPPKLADRDLSATELRIVRRMMDGLTDEFEKAWKPVQPVRFEFLREESHFLLADIAEPDDRVLQCSFEVQLNGQAGRLLFCLPFWLLDSLKSQLFEPTRNLQVEMDSHWANRLESEVQSADVELVAVLARQQMRIADVLSLNVGDIVPIDVPDSITAYVDGLPMVTGQYGVRHGRYAIKVQQVKHPSDLVDKLGRDG